MIVKVIDAAAPLKKINGHLEQSRLIISSFSENENAELERLFNQTMNGLQSLVEGRAIASEILKEEIIQAYSPVENCVAALSTAARELMKEIILPKKAYPPAL